MSEVEFEKGVITVLHRVNSRPNTSVQEIEESITEATGGEIHGDVEILSPEEVEELVGVPTQTPAIVQKTYVPSLTSCQLENSIQGVKKAIDVSYINYFINTGGV